MPLNYWSKECQHPEVSWLGRKKIGLGVHFVNSFCFRPFLEFSWTKLTDFRVLTLFRSWLIQNLCFLLKSNYCSDRPPYNSFERSPIRMFPVPIIILHFISMDNPNVCCVWNARDTHLRARSHYTACIAHNIIFYVFALSCFLLAFLVWSLFLFTFYTQHTHLYFLHRALTLLFFVFFPFFCCSL